MSHSLQNQSGEFLNEDDRCLTSSLRASLGVTQRVAYALFLCCKTRSMDLCNFNQHSRIYGSMEAWNYDIQQSTAVWVGVSEIYFSEMMYGVKMVCSFLYCTIQTMPISMILL